jgi:hypothetical protein
MGQRRTLWHATTSRGRRSAVEREASGVISAVGERNGAVRITDEPARDENHRLSPLLCSGALDKDSRAVPCPAGGHTHTHTHTHNRQKRGESPE